MFPYFCKKAVSRMLKNFCPDLIISTTTPLGFNKSISYLKIRNNKCKYYLILRDIWPEAFKLFDFDKRFPIIYKWYRKQESKLYELADIIGCMSEGNVEFVHESNPEVNKSKLRILPNWADVQKLLPGNEHIKTKYGLNNKFLLIGLATAWTSSKGLKDYVELSKYLPNDIKIMLVGLSPTQTSYLPKSIICVERTSNIGELVELYSAADVVLNLSYAETFGLTTAEGFACGTPGIVYNKTASPELISEGVGYVVEAGNIEQLLSAITIIKIKGKNIIQRIADKEQNNFSIRINALINILSYIMN